MHCDLTVRENLLNAAHFRSPNNWTTNELERFVDDVIEFLDLTEVAHTLIGDEETRGINAGQKKRVNIGLELASLPLILILDEPTSGLDSAAALHIMSSIQKISKIGITVGKKLKSTVISFDYSSTAL
jgi:ABC-type multidrug transport system ATPase subunit